MNFFIKDDVCNDSSREAIHLLTEIINPIKCDIDTLGIWADVYGDYISCILHSNTLQSESLARFVFGPKGVIRLYYINGIRRDGFTRFVVVITLADPNAVERIQGMIQKAIKMYKRQLKKPSKKLMEKVDRKPTKRPRIVHRRYK